MSLAHVQVVRGGGSPQGLGRAVWSSGAQGMLLKPSIPITWGSGCAHQLLIELGSQSAPQPSNADFSLLRGFTSSAPVCDDMDVFMRMKKRKNKGDAHKHAGQWNHRSKYEANSHQMGSSTGSQQYSDQQHNRHRPYIDTRVIFEQMGRHHTSGSSDSTLHRRHQGRVRRHTSAQPKQHTQQEQADRQQQQHCGTSASGTETSRPRTGKKRRRRRWHQDAWWRHAGWESVPEKGEGKGRKGPRTWTEEEDDDDESWYAEFVSRHHHQCHQSSGHTYTGTGTGAGEDSSWWTRQGYGDHQQYGQQQRQYEQYRWHYGQRLSAWWERYQRASHGVGGDGEGQRARNGAGGGGVRHSVVVVGHLATLGLGPGAVLSTDVLKEAFHRCAKQWHPDMHGSSGVTQEAHAAERFKEARAAYEALRAMC